MQAVILAAGRGSRLGQCGDSIPKCLLEVRRRPLIEHQLETLAEAGVAPVAMVVGYCADEIREEVGIRAEYVHNDRWKATNSLYSFWLTRDWVHADVVVANADTLFDPRILERLLDESGDAFAYDSGSGGAREHMKVEVRDGRLVDMSKELDAPRVAGENVGLLKFTRDGVRELFAIAGELIEAGHEKSWLGAAVRELATRRRIAAVDVAGLPWGEVDSAYDLAHVRKAVAPEIERRSRRKVPQKRHALVGALGLLTVALPAYAVLDGGSEGLAETAWESVELSGGEPLALRAGDRSQRWRLLRQGEPAVEGTVMGPARLRVASRVLPPAGHDGLASLPYVLEIRVDGELLDWYKLSKQPSSTWRHSGVPVGRRANLELELDSGPHGVSIGLAAAQSDACLVRLSSLKGDEDYD